ncbi:nucleotidyltransferase family protein [Candidatus Peregrinibacteria bacterium]|nr:MAG: nucleotidyltransferase family protein [Candidatus Peregrinibacteria bacterium]
MQDRIRISLTLKKEIVSLIDSKVDGVRIRNRSHAIEHYLKISLASSVGQAVLFVHREEDLLKEVEKESLIVSLLRRFQKIGILSVLFCSSQESLLLQKIVGGKKFQDFTFHFVHTNPEHTASALLDCSSLLHPGTFLVLHGDIATELDLFDFQDFHREKSSIATVTVTSISDPLPWGVVRLKRNLITEFREKPVHSETETRLTNLINAGIYAFEPEIFSFFPEDAKSLEEDVFPLLAQERKLFGYLLDGAWFNISVPGMLESAKKHFSPTP